jgi:hypothetical protein
MNLKTRDIYALAFVYLIGFMTIIASTVRYSVLYKWIVHPQISPTAITAQEMWATVETITANIAFCLPALRVVLRKPPKIFLYTYHTFGSGKQRPERLEINISTSFRVYGGSETELVSIQPSTMNK